MQQLPLQPNIDLSQSSHFSNHNHQSAVVRAVICPPGSDKLSEKQLSETTESPASYPYHIRGIQSVGTCHPSSYQAESMKWLWGHLLQSKRTSLPHKSQGAARDRHRGLQNNDDPLYPSSRPPRVLKSIPEHERVFDPASSCCARWHRILS